MKNPFKSRKQQKIDEMNQQKEQEKNNQEAYEILNETGKPLTDAEKKIILRILKEAVKKLPELKKSVVDGITEKEELIKTIMSMQEAMDMEDEKGNPYTAEDFRKMTISELTEFFEDALKFLEKNI